MCYVYTTFALKNDLELNYNKHYYYQIARWVYKSNKKCIINYVYTTKTKITQKLFNVVLATTPDATQTTLKS